MANPYFKFKKFTVWHDKCAMKVGTDGALLGAWAHVEQTKRVLDIGTGTGLIALMLAQRSQATVDAIDIDADACQQARENIASSPFVDRINVHHIPLAAYAPLHKGAYDLVVSNPPYFIDSMKCPDRKRNTARHTDTLLLPDLLHDCRELLAPGGHMALILPYDQREIVLRTSQENGLSLSEEVAVSPIASAKPKRWLVEFTTEEVDTPRRSHLSIETEHHHYTVEFTALVKDFYLKI